MNEPVAPLNCTADERRAASDAEGVANPYLACNALAGRLSKVQTPSSAIAAPRLNAAPPAASNCTRRRDACEHRGTDMEYRVSRCCAIFIVACSSMSRIALCRRDYTMYPWKTLVYGT